MKRTLNITVFLLLIPLALPAVDQVFLEPFNPVTPEILAVGRTSTANARGYNALFTNPGAFSVEEGSGFHISALGTAYVPVTQLNTVASNFSSFQNFDVSQPGSPAVSLVNDFLTKYGVGAQASFGIGYVGHGFGIAFVNDERTFAKGPLFLGSAATVDITQALCIGYSLPFDIQVGKLHIGIAARPMEKTYAEVPVNSLYGKGSNLSAISVLSGFGMGLDLGALAEMGQFSAGIVLRDIGSTSFNFKTYTLSELSNPASVLTSMSSTTSANYRIPMTIALGGSWKPEIPLYKNIFEPQVMVDLQIPLKDQYTEPSFLTWIHAGAEAKFLSFLSVRTGINQGYFTLGMGMKVYFWEISWALYADELGRYAGTNKRSGITFQTALKF